MKQNKYLINSCKLHALSGVYFFSKANFFGLLHRVGFLKNDVILGYPPVRWTQLKNETIMVTSDPLNFV